MADDGGNEGGGGTTSYAVDGNRLTLLPGGPERLAALMALIEDARERLDLCFYIFSDDPIGRRVIHALVAARERGVAVTLMVDAFGCAFSPVALFRPLAEAGARIGWFGRRRSMRYLIRNHQKLVLADGKHVLIGGLNVAQDYFAPDDDITGWRDMGLLVEGALALELERWVDALAAWTLSERQSFRALRRLVREWQPSGGAAVWLMGGPTRHLNGWARRIKHDLQDATRLDMVAAYFSPGHGMVRRINAIARRGTARLVVPMRSDNHATVGATRHLYRRMLRCGVALLEYRPQKLHSKLLAMDDVAYVGSANFDMRSLFLNVELMLRVEDRAFAAAVRAEVAALAAHSRVIDRHSYRMMAGPLSRLRWWFDYLLVAVLDYTVTRRLNFRRDRRD